MRVLALLLACLAASPASCLHRSRWTMSMTKTRPQNLPRLLATWTSIIALGLSPGELPLYWIQGNPLIRQVMRLLVLKE